MNLNVVERGFERRRNRVITENIETLKVWVDCLNKIDWNYSNQTMKILKRLHYEKIGRIELFTWQDEEVNENSEIGYSEEDVKKYIEIITSIAIYLSVFDDDKAKELLFDEFDDDINDKEVENLLLNDIGLQSLNQTIDKFLAMSLLIFLNDEKDLSDEYENLSGLSECFYQVVISFIDIRTKNQALKEDNYIEWDSDINTYNLRIGATIKNYKELCELIDQEVKGGKSKKLQLENFKRYFDWEKSGQKFIITDVYDVPLTKEDNRKLGNNNIYVKYIETILLRFLSKQEGYTKTLKKMELWKLLGMVNSKYNRVTSQELQKMDCIITQFEINHFYQRCNQKLEKILFTALNNLKNRKLIIWELQTVIVDKDDKYFLADDSHLRSILNVERNVLREMGFEKIIQVYFRFKQNEYYEKVNNKLFELYEWRYFFKQIKLIYEPKNIIEALPESEIQLQKSILNQKIMDALQVNAKEKFTKQQNIWNEEYKRLEDYYSNDWGIPWKPNPNDIKIFKYPSTYLEAQKMLTDELVNIRHKNSKINFDLIYKQANEDKELNDLFDYMSLK